MFHDNNIKLNNSSIGKHLKGCINFSTFTYIIHSFISFIGFPLFYIVKHSFNCWMQFFSLYAQVFLYFIGAVLLLSSFMDLNCSFLISFTLFSCFRSLLVICKNYQRQLTFISSLCINSTALFTLNNSYLRLKKKQDVTVNIV